MIEELKKMINESNNIVFFGGAGVSTESGIPDFRSKDGLYNQKYNYPPETILSHTFFIRNTLEFYRFYKEKMIVHNVKPNLAHNTLVTLERQGKLKAIITQNIDGLHQKAGSKNVIELHGSILRNYCIDCGEFYEGTETIENSIGIPRCIKCGGIIKPDVVLYEEELSSKALTKAVDYISQADLLIVGGTSMNVYPAAGLVNYFKGNKIVIINKSETNADYKANLVIHDLIGNVLSKVI